MSYRPHLSITAGYPVTLDAVCSRYDVDPDEACEMIRDHAEKAGLDAAFSGDLSGDLLFEDFFIIGRALGECDDVLGDYAMAVKHDDRISDSEARQAAQLLTGKEPGIRRVYASLYMG